MANVAHIKASNRFAGLKNYTPNGKGSVAIPVLGLASGTYRKFSFTIPVRRSDAITSFRARLTGLETFWHQIKGYVQLDRPNLAAWQYSVQIQGYYSGSNFNVDVYVINQSAGPITVPAFTVDGELDLFVAPF